MAVVPASSMDAKKGNSIINQFQFFGILILNSRSVIVLRSDRKDQFWLEAYNILPCRVNLERLSDDYISWIVRPRTNVHENQEQGKKSASFI